jgi:FkbM family methyltransferase
VFNLHKACRHGEMVFNRHDRYIGRSLEVYGEFSEAEVRLLGRLLPPDALVIEAGANVGAHTVPLSRIVADGAVIAFEPQRLVYHLLCANLALNSIANVYAYQKAVGAASGSIIVPQLDPTAETNFGGLSLGDWKEGEVVPLVRLDDMGLPRLDLLKADVEGMEGAVLAGAAATIERHRPILYLENDRPDQADELCNRIRALRYRIYWHTPPLFSDDNFAGVHEDIFDGIASINVLCMPSESEWRPDSEPYLRYA